MNFSLSFNETFSDGTFDFSDVLGPVSGSMTAGSSVYSFAGVRAFSYQFDPAGALSLVRLQFTGSGPTLGGGDFFGLFADINPDLTLSNGVSIGCGFTTDFGDGGAVTSYRYAVVTASNYVITPAGTAQVPDTLPLVMPGMLGLPAVRLVRRRSWV